MSSFAKDLFAVVKSRGAVIASGVLTSVITARYLGPEGNGIVAALTVYPNLFMAIGSLGIRQSTAFYIAKEDSSDEHIFSSVLYLWVFSSFLCLACCYVLLRYFTKGTYDQIYILLALSPIPFALLTTYSSGLFLGKNLIREFNTVNWVPNVVKLVAYVALIMILPWDVYGALIGIFLGYLLLTFLVWGKVRRIVKVNWNFHWPIIKELLSLGIIYALALLVINLNYKINVMFLEKLSTPFEVGIYSKGVSIVEHLWDIPTLLSTIIFARSATSKDPKAFSLKVAQLLRICFVVILISSIAFFILSDVIMVTMYGKEFIKSSEVQRQLLPGIFLMTIFKVLNMDMAGKGKPMPAMYAMIPSLIINAALNWILAPRFGANGAAIASTISYSISAILFLIIYSRYVNISIRTILTFRSSDFDFAKKYMKKFESRFNLGKFK